MQKYSLISMIIVAALAASASPQPVQGDLVLTSDSNQTGIYYSTSYALYPLWSGLATGGVKMKYQNSYVYAIGANSGNIYQLSSLGVLNTVTTATPSGCVALELDQDGSYMVANNKTGCLYRLTGTRISTFLTLPTSWGRPAAICRDGRTGDWAVGTTTGKLILVDRVSASATEIYAGATMSSIFGVAYMPQEDRFAVVRSRFVTPPYPGRTIQELAILSGGRVHHTREIRDASALAVHHKTGRIIVVTRSGSVVELTGDAKVLSSRSTGSHGFSGVDIWDDQNVSLDTTGEQGTYARINLRFFRSKAKPFVVALSLGQRPGLAFGPDNVLNLAPDPFFFITAAGGLPYWTYNFAGTTTSSGGAYASFTIPWSFPVGTCIYVGAAVVNPAFPDNLDVGNVECIQVK